MPLINHDDYRKDLAAALHASDLARIQPFPPSLLLRADAYIPTRGRAAAAPFACALDLALNALNDMPLAWAAPTPSADPDVLSNLAAQLVDGTPEFVVIDWLLDRFPELLNMPMDTLRRNAYGGGTVTTQTPLQQTLSHFTRSRPYEAIALLDRLLRLGASTRPHTVPLGSPQGSRLKLSALCFALDTASLPAGAHAVRRLIAAGARLEPGESPLAVQRALFAMGAVAAEGGQRFKGARALRTLLPLYAGCLFENLEEQERAAGIWMRDSEGAPETLDALLQLGLRLDVVRRLVGVDATYNAARRTGFEFLESQRSHESLRLAEEAAAERAMRTLSVRAALRRERLPFEIASDIARRASADAPSWQLALGPMDPPRSAAIAAADARAEQRRVSVARSAKALT